MMPLDFAYGTVERSAGFRSIEGVLLVESEAGSDTEEYISLAQAISQEEFSPPSGVRFNFLVTSEHGYDEPEEEIAEKKEAIREVTDLEPLRREEAKEEKSNTARIQ